MRRRRYIAFPDGAAAERARPCAAPGVTIPFSIVARADEVIE